MKRDRIRVVYKRPHIDGTKSRILPEGAFIDLYNGRLFNSEGKPSEIPIELTAIHLPDRKGGKYSRYLETPEGHRVVEEKPSKLKLLFASALVLAAINLGAAPLLQIPSF